MKAAVIHEAGGPAVLKLESLAIPTPQNGEVLIRVKAFGINRSELFTRQGHSPNVKFPRVLGIEAVGLVESAPGGEFRTGDLVATADKPSLVIALCRTVEFNVIGPPSCCSALDRLFSSASTLQLAAKRGQSVDFQQPRRTVGTNRSLQFDSVPLIDRAFFLAIASPMEDLVRLFLKPRFEYQIERGLSRSSEALKPTG